MDSKQSAYRVVNPNVELILCVFFGFLGAHRFYAKKTGSAVLYLLTGGLCGIGWIVDIVTIAVKISKGNSTVTQTSPEINASGDCDYAFVPKTGKKFHNDPLCGGNDHLQRLQRRVAVANGYTQCERCRDYYMR